MHKTHVVMTQGVYGKSSILWKCIFTDVKIIILYLFLYITNFMMPKNVSWYNNIKTVVNIRK